MSENADVKFIIANDEDDLHFLCRQLINYSADYEMRGAPFLPRHKVAGR